MVGTALARRLGARSPRSLAGAAALASLADLDIPAGYFFHGDAWKMHRQLTHTVLFAVAAGAAIGAAGLFSTSPVGSHRRFRDALAGAVIACTHPALDNLPYVKLSTKPFVPPPGRRRLAGMSIANWLLDTALCAALAWAIHSDSRAGTSSSSVASGGCTAKIA